MTMAEKLLLKNGNSNIISDIATSVIQTTISKLKLKLINDT